MLQSIKNLSIRRKLKLAFGTIILFCTVAALLGALGIGTVFTHSRTLYTDYGQAQGAVNRILAVFKQNELLTGSLLLNRDPQGQQQLLTALTANRADLLDRLEAGDAAGYFDHLDPGDLLELESLLDTYFAAQAQVVQMVEDGSADDAVSRFTQELLVAGEAVDGMVQQIIAAQELAGQEMLSRLGTTTAQVMILLGGFALFALIYSLVVTIRMSASIGQSVQGLMDGMAQIYAASQEMGRVVQSIENIAFQTNLLALNAAVEAARAGSSGKGFAVIADTVRHLAIKSSEEAKETARLLQSTQSAVDLGRELAADAADLLRDTAGAAEESAASTARVLSALTEQTAALEQIDSGLEQISAVIQNNSASSQESAAASEQLHAQSSELERHVRVFSLD